MILISSYLLLKVVLLRGRCKDVGCDTHSCSCQGENQQDEHLGSVHSSGFGSGKGTGLAGRFASLFGGTKGGGRVINVPTVIASTGRIAALVFVKV